MSEPFGFSVYYHDSFDRGSIVAIAEAVRRAVAENWAEHRDRLSDPAPRFSVDPGDWLLQAAPGKTHGLLGRNQPPLFTDHNCFNYSPVAAETGCIKLAEWDDGSISALFLIAERARFERPGRREELRPESERQLPPPDAPRPFEEGYEEWEEAWYAPFNVDPWPINKRCILHILERLKEAMPVREVSLDSNLLD